ncbi:MAG: hypothetical protein JSV17_16625 [Candidatus Aminicenantes bacterium]|nr:MAG: hypothetical protein JSV17_16625 [Candidatus Aminicenantes bacterium]
MKVKSLILAFTLCLLPCIGLCTQSDMTIVSPLTEAGEELDLYGVLELFQEAEDLEAFEKALNDPNSEVNNLDLDENGKVDYIRVEEYVEGNTHVIVLQVPLEENEYQDVTTIEIEKKAIPNTPCKLSETKRLTAQIISSNRIPFREEDPL